MAHRNITASDLTFGIEIEGQLPTRTINDETIQIGGYHRGIQIPGLPPGWKAEDDCSIDGRSGFENVEIVSPILRGADGLRQLIEVCQQLRLWGWKMNTSCGCHIHIGTSALRSDSLTQSPEFLRKVAALVMRNETGLFAATGTKTREYNYSYSSSARADLAAIIRTLTPESARRYTERGRTLNLQPLVSDKQTIEFRVFQSGIKVSKVATYVQLCLGLVAKAYSMKRRAKFSVDNADLQGTGGRVHQLKHDLCWLNYRGMAEKRHGRILSDDQIEAFRAIGDTLGFAPTVAESILELDRLGAKYDSDTRRETGHRMSMTTR
jgi:hypothetical protein